MFHQNAFIPLRHWRRIGRLTTTFAVFCVVFGFLSFHFSETKASEDDAKSAPVESETRTIDESKTIETTEFADLIDPIDPIETLDSVDPTDPVDAAKRREIARRLIAETIAETARITRGADVIYGPGSGGGAIGSDAFLDSTTANLRSGRTNAASDSSAPLSSSYAPPTSSYSASASAYSANEPLYSSPTYPNVSNDRPYSRNESSLRNSSATSSTPIDATVTYSTPESFEASSGFAERSKSTRSKGLFGYPVETGAKEGDTFYERWVEPDSTTEVWTKQILPQGLMYPSYLAGRKESRLESIITYDDDYGTLWDITLGGRAPIFRYGTTDPVRPEGWEIELEGAALLRLDWERGRKLAATDYRAGVPIVYGTKRWQFKTGYYHVSSHLGDNYLMDNFRRRVHYSRDALMLGLAFTPTSDVRLYAEMDYAFHCGHTTEPFEFQFGFEYSPQFDPYRSNWAAKPFFATHAHLYEERDFGGYWATQTGVQWRSASNSLLRLGAEFFLGGDDLYQFHTTYQRKYGVGLWYDF